MTQPIVKNKNEYNATPFFPYEIRMLNSHEGWAFGKHPTKNEIILLSTQDGGSNWEEINFIQPLVYENSESSITPPNSKFFVLPTGDAWFIQEQDDQLSVIHSSDKGKTWIQGSSFHKEGFPLGISFVNPRLGWIAVE